MEVNEQIVKAYFEVIHSYIVKTNHPFIKKREKGSGPSDIDLVMHYPKGACKSIFGRRAICSVKGWQSHRVSLKEIKDIRKFKKQWKIFEGDEIEAANEFFGTQKFTKILIVPPIIRKDLLEAKKYCLNKYDIYLLDFSEILIELLEYLSSGRNSKKSYDSQALQILRIVAINMITINKSNILLKENFVSHLGITSTNFNAKIWRKREIKIVRPQKTIKKLNAGC